MRYCNVSFHLPYARQYSNVACRMDQARVCVRQVSPDERMVAWGEDRRGNEAYYLRVRDIATGKDLLQQPIKVRTLASVITSLFHNTCAQAVSTASQVAYTQLKSLVKRAVGTG